MPEHCIWDPGLVTYSLHTALELELFESLDF